MRTFLLDHKYHTSHNVVLGFGCILTATLPILHWHRNTANDNGDQRNVAQKPERDLAMRARRLASKRWCRWVLVGGVLPHSATIGAGLNLAAQRSLSFSSVSAWKHMRVGIYNYMCQHAGVRMCACVRRRVVCRVRVCQSAVDTTLLLFGSADERMQFCKRTSLPVNENTRRINGSLLVYNQSHVSSLSR